MAESEDKSTGLPLAVDNICKQLQGVDCIVEDGLGSALKVPHRKRREIAQRHSTQASQTRAVIEYWLSVDPTPSWRRLLRCLEMIGEHHTAERVKPYMEPLTDPSITAENVCSILEPLRDWNIVGTVVGVPVSKMESIHRTCRTDTQRRRAAVDWWLRYSPTVTWNWLAMEIYYYVEKTPALEAVSQYTYKDTEDNLNLKNLEPVLSGVSLVFEDDSGYNLSGWLHVPRTVVREIRKMTSDHILQKKIVLERWLRDSPAPTWEIVAEALYGAGEHDALEHVKVFTAADVPLTIDNICKVLHGVDCMKEDGLGTSMKIPRLKREEITQRHFTQANQTRAAVEYWLLVDPNPSWRRLLRYLDQCNEYKAAERVKLFVESLTGVSPDPSLTAENVSSVLEALRDWRIVSAVVGVPYSKQVLIERTWRTDTQRRRAAVDWWLRYSPTTSWNWLAMQIYYYVERTTALESVSQYIRKETAELTIANLESVLSGVTQWFEDDFGYNLSGWLQVPRPVVREICRQTSDPILQRKTFLKRWLQDCPAPTWAAVAEAVYGAGEHDALEQVNKMCITNCEASGARQIHFSDLKFGDEDVLGVGAGTTVYKGMWISRNLAVAIKRVTGKISVKEADIHSQLHHPNIIQLQGVVKSKPDYFLIMELAGGGSLFDFIHKHYNHPDLAQSLKWAKQTAEGMKYLHERKILHRDLKSQNVLLTADLTVKLCDFGWAKEFDSTKPVTQVGTYRWMAPEIMKKEPVSLSCDVFSYGMLLLELLTCDLPFAGDTNELSVVEKIMNGEKPSIPDTCEPYLAHLLESCWSTNPRDRPRFSEILSTLDSGHTKEAVLRKIDYSDLFFGEELGVGVYQGQWRTRKLAVAIKQVAGGIREANLHSQLHHPNVIHLHGIAKRRPDYYLVMEFAEGGSLYDRIHQQHCHPKVAQKMKWAKEIAKGMNYLHQRKILHRDLKSANVLLTADQAAKICDFGIAKKFDATKPGTEVGTFRWMAPEIMKNEPVSLSCDVFSYGMVLFELLTCELPFAGVSELSVVGKIKSGEKPPVPDSCEPYLAHLLERCWSTDPKERPRFSEILSTLDNKAM